MEKQTTTLPELTLVGLTARTNNKNEMNPEKSKIANLVGYYWGNQIGNKIQNRIQPGITYSVYTNFESDENGDYTYFVGEAVNSTEGQDFDTFESLIFKVFALVLSSKCQSSIYSIGSAKLTLQNNKPRNMIAKSFLINILWIFFICFINPILIS